VADTAFDYYNTGRSTDEDDEDVDDDVDMEDLKDERSRKGYKGSGSDKRKKGSGREKNNRASASSTKISQQRKHESDEDPFENEFIDRETEDLPPLDERYNPSPKRKKLDAQLLDSEVDLDSVLNSDGELRSSAPASPSTSSDSGGTGNNFFTSVGRSASPITGEIRRDSSICSPQEYEILKVREKGNETKICSHVYIHTYPLLSSVNPPILFGIRRIFYSSRFLHG